METASLYNNKISLAHCEVLVNNRVKNIKKEYGIFFTPEWVVDFMVNLINSQSKNRKNITILEPACGLAQFLTGIKKNKPSLFTKARLFGVEINKEIINYLNILKMDNKINLIFHDYLLWDPDFSFDIVIGNPPYGIPGNSYHYPIKIEPQIKSQYKKIYQTWYGKYNVYGAFIEKSIKLLKKNGQLIFIVPATFMILDEFKKLRQFLSNEGTTQIIYMGPDIFKPEAAVASVILNFNKTSNRTGRLELFGYKQNNNILQIKEDNNWHGEVVLFETAYTKHFKDLCPSRLGDFFEVEISPRTPEIKRNPDVIKQTPTHRGDYLPLLNGRNLTCNKITYDNLTGYWIKKSKARKLRGYFVTPHIVIGLGFRENGKVGAAYDEKCYPWMGDVYHLLKNNHLFTNKRDLSDLEIVEYLNSEFVKKYIKHAYREITYHLSKTQLKNIPLPTKRELKQIKEAL